tara:strand:+ start:269 stop:484 length:216 start_codon:yes stop_codon:yes gene_type:complete
MMKTISIGSTPRKAGRERKMKMNTIVSRSEDSQPRNACSNSSSRSEACSAIIKVARNEIGSGSFIRIEKTI